MRKLGTIGISIATVLSLAGAGVLAPVAGAVTIAELQAQIATLTAQLAALTGGTSTTACYAFNVDLTVGSTGPDVTTLQNYLQGTGHFTFAGGATGYFGPITQTAVAAWQAANGIAPAVGYFGPISRAKYNTLCSSTPATPETPGTSSGLEGGSGSADYKLLSTWSGEEVGEGADDVEVSGLEVEAIDSDLELKAVRVNFDQGTADNDFEEYADEVSIWLDGEEFGRVDADDFNDDNAFQSTIALDSGAVVEEGEKGELVVAVSGARNIDSNDVTETWTVDFTQVRYMDAAGSSVSEDPGTGTRTFSFETFATASSLELHITLADNDAVNKAHLVDVHATENTRVTILDFELENKGDTDLEYNEFGVNLDVTGSADVDDFIAGGTSPQIYLVLDGEDYGTASYQDDADDISVGTDEDILFDDVNFTHPAGETVSGQIEVTIRGLDEDPDVGDTIQATLGETETDQTALVDVRDESNTQLADAQITGSAAGEANEIRDVGFDIALVGTPTAVKTAGNASTGTSDSAEYTITFDVTAWGGSIFIDATSPTRAGTTESNVTTSVSTGTLTTDIRTDSGASESASAFTVLEGQTERFSVIGRVGDGDDDLADGYLDMSLSSLRYNLTDATGTLTYTLNLGEFRTPAVFLDDQE
ncbi:MAG: hypothetical protein COT89_00890 [Candidatus Colwellbacteria bacterium CG10_big_fil_rev_8_21_14_0_10_42_22]|uniref:Peptidoglycan binding-like domain-containing protein n=1 Tax=Candidatus Colwellbacteria bacterium CG10_big_fil_rev_8_21_14_0_10_42_22 TaxID=1974540 RepID=A0A2H0VIS1_9BACT|nr:MAG: hypothetical protein COT89_00890 [Candidatus Colwellbacteria bacterium CG10_big_fil_rev_8_21_14_0_10_42_22]